MKSSGDHAWPWSDLDDEEAAEAAFHKAFRAIHEHLKNHEDRLRGRTDQGHFWWELRSCDYYENFENPKIVHTDITWRAEFAFVDEPMDLVNTAYMWPTDDLYLLGVMNSPLMWSYMWRHAQDEALRMFTSSLKRVPIAAADEEIREQVSLRVRELVEITDRERTGVEALHDWLRVDFGLNTPGEKLGHPRETSPDDFVAEVKKDRSGKSKVSSAELERLRDEYRATIVPMQEAAGRALEIEGEISGLVSAAYGLTPDEVDLLWRTAPPRMPADGATPAAGGTATAA